MTNKTMLIEEVRSVADAIYENDYYLPIWEQVKHVKPLEECTVVELLEPFQEFWESLPDSSAIHRKPFYRICDLAEQYCEIE